MNTITCTRCGGAGKLDLRNTRQKTQKWTPCPICDGWGRFEARKADARAAGVRYMPSQAVMDFIGNYTYRGGDVTIDGWVDLRNGDETSTDREGRYAGDCDEFAVTVASIIEGGFLGFLRAVLTHRVVFWLAHSPVNTIWWKPRHVILYHKDHGWIDSTERYWRDGPQPHKPRVPLLLPWVLFRLLMGQIYRVM